MAGLRVVPAVTVTSHSTLVTMRMLAKVGQKGGVYTYVRVRVYTYTWELRVYTRIVPAPPGAGRDCQRTAAPDGSAGRPPESGRRYSAVCPVPTLWSVLILQTLDQ